MACAPTAAVKFVNMADDWCMVFKVFDLLLLSFLLKNTSEDLKKFQKCSSEVWKVKTSFISKIFCYLFRTCSRSVVSYRTSTIDENR